MLSSLALIAALTYSPSAESGLTLSGARMTYGELGATRPDAKFLPGDIFLLSFDIDGIKVDKAGRVKYSMGMEVVNKDGAPILKQAPQKRENDFLPLGGSKLPARAYVTIGLDQPPGVYTCRVTVIDDASKASQTIEQKFEVMPKNFGLIMVFTSYDAKGEVPAPPLGIAGQPLFLHFTVVGFARDPKTKQPNVDVEMSILGKDGQPTVAEASTVAIDSGVEAEADLIHLYFHLPLNRVGDYTIDLKAVDKVNKSTAKVQLPLKVLSP